MIVHSSFFLLLQSLPKKIRFEGKGVFLHNLSLAAAAERRRKVGTSADKTQSGTQHCRKDLYTYWREKP